MKFNFRQGSKEVNMPGMCDVTTQNNRNYFEGTVSVSGKDYDDVMQQVRKLQLDMEKDLPHHYVQILLATNYTTS